jgi:hypothetical protein
MKPGLRFEVFKRDDFVCRYCGRRSPAVILEVDHVIPRSGGGRDDLENLVTSCFECNRGKSARLLSAMPLEEDLHERTVQIAERELQISEYDHWRARQRAREDIDLANLRGKWAEKWGGYEWQDSTVRKTLRVLSYQDVLDILEIVAEQTERYGDRSWSKSAWIFFCGICRKRVQAIANAKPSS